MKSAVFGLFLAGFVLGGPVLFDPMPISVDMNHSNIGFAVPIAGGLSEVHGKFSRFSMELNYDDKDVTRSSVDVTIDTDSVDTGIDQRDAHLRTADFFEVEKYPKITFKSKKVIRTGDQLTLVGDFTMHGVTKEISFPFTIRGPKIDEKRDTFIMGFFAVLSINRREYGVNYSRRTSPDFIGDNVKIRLNIMTKSNKRRAQ